MSENPARKVKMFSEENTARDRTLSEEEEQRFMGTLAPHIKPVVITALHTGLRYRKVLDPCWSHVNLEKRQLKVENTKSCKARFIPINAVLFELLRGLRAESKGNKQVFPFRSVRTGFENACRRAKIEDFTFHDLRRTFGTRLLEKGVNIVTISRLYGHSNVLVTQRYLHPRDELSREAVELLVGEDRSKFEIPSEEAHICHTQSGGETPKQPLPSYFSMN